jgi:hypothetical protein
MLRYIYIARLLILKKALRLLSLAETCCRIIKVNARKKKVAGPSGRAVYGSAAAGLLSLLIRIPPGAWMFVCCVSCVVRWKYPRRAGHPSRGVLPTVVCLECDLETSRMRRP